MSTSYHHARAHALEPENRDRNEITLNWYRHTHFICIWKRFTGFTTEFPPFFDNVVCRQDGRRAVAHTSHALSLSRYYISFQIIFRVVVHFSFCCAHYYIYFCVCDCWLLNRNDLTNRFSPCSVRLFVVAVAGVLFDIFFCNILYEVPYLFIHFSFYMILLLAFHFPSTQKKKKKQETCWRVINKLR